MGSVDALQQSCHLLGIVKILLWCPVGKCLVGTDRVVGDFITSQCDRERLDGQLCLSTLVELLVEGALDAFDAAV